MTIATLGLAVDSSSVASATPALERLTAASAKAENAATALGRASTSSSGGMRQIASAAQGAQQQVQRLGAAIDGARFQTAGLAAQFQDVGITAAMGMSPLLIGLQQGTQLAGQLATMANPIKGLGQAFVSLVSPVSLLAIGFTTLLAAGIQWGAGLLSATNDADRALADTAMSLGEVEGAVKGLTSITDDYARAMLDTANAHSSATATILANSEKEFRAKQSLLELELKRQDAAVAIARADIDSARSKVVGKISEVTGFGVGQDLGNLSESFGNGQVGPWVREPWRDEAMKRTNTVLADPANAAALDKVKELAANLDLAEVARDKLAAGLELTFADSVAESVIKVGDSAKKAAEDFDVFGRIMSDVSHLLWDANDPFLELQSNMDKLGALLAAGEISWDQYGKAVARANLNAATDTLGAVGQITGALAGAFEDNKALAVANAVVNTAQGITKALAEGGPFGFPIAAAIGIAGAAQIASIMSAKPGSTSVAGVNGGATSASAAPSGAEKSHQTVLNITFTGGSAARYSPDDIREFFRTAAESAGDGNEEIRVFMREAGS